MSWQRETLSSDGGFYQKPRCVRQSEIDNDKYKEVKKDEKPKTESSRVLRSKSRQ